MPPPPRRPLCFVLMPFGSKTGLGGRTVDFDQVYDALIRPAIEAANMEPLRADEELAGGIIHKPMYERLMLCEYAVADLTTANANVFYELGVRHAVRPWSTLLLFAETGSRLPFDVAMLRALPYHLTAVGAPAQPDLDGAAITARLSAGRDATVDSPIFQLVEGFPDIQRLKTDVFRDRVDYNAHIKQRLAEARRKGVAAVREIHGELGTTGDLDNGVAIDLLLSYRAVKAWTDVIALVDIMARPVADTVLVREQLGFALNRAGRSAEAERVLLDLISEKGRSSETLGLLGRVYKDRWESAAAAAETVRAQGLLDKAIATYLAGFEADWRDAYPGVNAATLMTLRTPPDDRAAQLIPIVRYAVERRIAGGQPDYWDYATLLELAVLGSDEARGTKALADAVANIREVWEPETTERNLRLIREARARRQQVLLWADQAERELHQLTAPK